MKRRNRRKYSLMFLCLFFAVLSLPRLRNLIRHQRRLNEYHAEILSMEEENARLIEQIDALRNDPYYTEKLLRENYGYIKEGELIYRIKN